MRPGTSPDFVNIPSWRQPNRKTSSPRYLRPLAISNPCRFDSWCWPQNFVCLADENGIPFLPMIEIDFCCSYIYIIIVFWLVDVCECLSWYYHLWIYDMFFVIQYVIWSNWIFDNCLSGTSCEDPVISSYIIYYSNRSWWDTPSLPGLLFFIEPGTTTLSHEVLVGLPGIGWKTGLLYLVEWGSEAFKKLDIPPPQHPAKS